MKKKKSKNMVTHFASGGAAGICEATTIHPLDTIKTRMQLARGVGKVGVFGTGMNIVGKEGFFALYKGWTAQVSQRVLTMSCRFFTFEYYKNMLGQRPDKPLEMGGVFLAGLGAGMTEAALIVTPFEVCKIRMQSQFHSMADPGEMQARRYRNVVHTAYRVTTEEGPSALWKGLGPTMARQACNQGCNFTGYNILTSFWKEKQGGEIAAWQTFLSGGISGAIGPLCNCPLDVVKTRLQKQVIMEGQTPKYTGMIQAISLIGKEEGIKALWKGITPRLLRIIPGQAVTFTVYEQVATMMGEKL